MLRAKIKRGVAIFFLCLFVFSVGIVVLPAPKASAITGSYMDDVDINGAVLDHQLYYFLVSCFYTVNMDRVEDEDVDSWEWLQGGDTNDDTDLYTRTAVRGGMYDQSVSNCKDGKRVGEAFGRFGFSGKDGARQAFCSLSFTWSKKYGGNGNNKGSYGGDTKACLSGFNTEDARDEGFDGTASYNDQVNGLDALLKDSSKYEKAKGNLTDAEEFVRMYRTLAKGCSLNLVNDYETGAAVGDEKLVKVPVVTGGDAEITYALGEVGLGDGWQVPIVATRTGGEKTMNCGQLANAAVDKAQAYKDYLAEKQVTAAQTAAPSDTETGTYKADCGGFEAADLLTFGLSWVMCPLVQAAFELASVLEDQVAGMLCVNESEIFGGDMTCDGTAADSSISDAFHAAWGTFRFMALGLLAIAGLIMILSQGLGFEILDAYTIKKTLPRILIAAVGISLSWELLEFLVRFSNMLGIGVRSLIYSPFSSVPINLDIMEGGAKAIGTMFALGGYLTLGVMGLLSFLATGALALIIAFFVLVIRNILVILLIIVAPLAIAMYILPNTEKYYKIWWDWLFKALLAFPIITGMIAIGHVFAAITAARNDTTFSAIVAFIAYFAPYFLIPAAFRLAGGALATIGGFANDRSRGAFDRLKKFRQGKSAQNMEKMRNYDRFSERSKFGRGLNTLTGTAANPSSLLGYSKGVKAGNAGISARKHSQQALQGQAMLKENKIFQANQNDDNFLLALADKKLAQTKLNTARANFNSATGEDKMKYQTEVAARELGLANAGQMNYFDRENRSTRIAAFDALTKTGYQYSAGKEGYQEVRDTAASIYGEDNQQAMAQAMDTAQYNLRASGGRFDLGGINHGNGYDYETGIDKGSGYTAGQGKTETFVAGARHYLGDGAMKKDDNGTLVPSKTASASEMQAHIAKNINSGDLEVGKIVDWHAKLTDAEHSATGANKNEILKQKQAIEAVVATSQGFSADMRSGPELELQRGLDNNRRHTQSFDPNHMDDH